jgi:hypothetical protein
VAYAKILDAKRTKLDDKSEKCIFVRYGDRRMGYKLYNPITRKVIMSRDVIFEDNHHLHPSPAVTASDLSNR